MLILLCAKTCLPKSAAHGRWLVAWNDNPDDTSAGFVRDQRNAETSISDYDINLPLQGARLKFVVTPTSLAQGQVNGSIRKDDVDTIVATAADAVESLVAEGLDATQRRFN